MVFYTIQYFTFFLVLLFLLKILKGARNKKILLLLASIFFYAYWDIRFVALLVLLALINFLIGKSLDIENEHTRKMLLVIGMGLNISVLAVFKYLNFFIDSANIFLEKLGFGISSVSLILPLGISFFIFEFISYLVDVYKYKLPACEKILDFSIFVFFFPRLASGPIIRPEAFLPQLEREIVITRKNIVDGFQIFLLGLFKKLVIADTLSSFVDQVYSNPSIYSSTTIWIVIISYSLQIYCDFSGYSDMAIGSAKMIGFKLPINFNMPYISLSITEFWTRWHISLSSWLKDYLYIPLGGNRASVVRKNINLLTTMLLGGLWHGANWNFVIWGLIHGIALIVHKIFSGRTKNWAIKNLYIWKTCSVLLTFFFVSICWVFFRSGSFTVTVIVLNKLFNFKPNTSLEWIMPQAFILAGIVIAATLFKIYWNWLYKSDNYIVLEMKKIGNFIVLIILIICTFLMSGTEMSPFIYFQF